MSAVDFGEWVAPDLKLELGGRTYVVRTPSVEASGMLIAAALRAEVNLGLVKAEIPVEVQDILDTIGDRHPALGDAYGQMKADGVGSATIDRMAYYAVFYWTRGKEYADTLANMLWHPREIGSAPADDVAPKG